MLKDISYTDYRRSDDIHGTVLYPAVMVAPVQKDVLKDLYKKDTIHSILDPFMALVRHYMRATEFSRTPGYMAVILTLSQT